MTPRRAGRSRGLGRAAVVLAAALLAPPVHAQVSVPGKGHGAVTLTLQTVSDHYHLTYRGDEIDAGRIKANSAQLRLDYGLTGRVAVHVTVPFIDKRYRGDVPHDTGTYDGDDDPHASRVAAAADGGPLSPQQDGPSVVDDGDWHGTWQDWGVGVRWNWKQRPWMLTPFATYSQPMRDYTFYGHAAAGTRQRRLALGLAFGRQFGPRFPKLYAQGQYSYTFVEEVLDVPVDYSTLNLELGYFFTPRWSARVFANYRKTHGGLEFPIDFPPPRNDERWLHHDRIQRIDYLNVGLGAGFKVDDKWSVSGNWMTTAWGENGHAIHNAVSIGVTRSF